MLSMLLAQVITQEREREIAKNLKLRRLLEPVEAPPAPVAEIRARCLPVRQERVGAGS
jgi:hypothetical protein